MDSRLVFLRPLGLRLVQKGQRELQSLLRQAFDPEHVTTSLTDFNSVGFDALSKYLLGLDPDNWRAQNKTSQELDSHYAAVAQVGRSHVVL